MKHRFSTVVASLLLLLLLTGTARREAKEKVEAKERYMKVCKLVCELLLLLLTATVQLHVQGKTEQAQKDLARLAKIKAEREAALAKRKAEADGVLLPRCFNLFRPRLTISTSQSSGDRSQESGW